MRRADHSSRGVLPTVVRRMLPRNLVNEEALAHWGLLGQKQTNKFSTLPLILVELHININ